MTYEDVYTIQRFIFSLSSKYSRKLENKMFIGFFIQTIAMIVFAYCMWWHSQHTIEKINESFSKLVVVKDYRKESGQ